MAISTEEGRQALRAGFGTPESADAGLREIALAFKAAQNGSVDDKRAFQLAYQDRLTLPDDFSTHNVAAVKQAQAPAGRRHAGGLCIAAVGQGHGRRVGRLQRAAFCCGRCRVEKARATLKAPR